MIKRIIVENFMAHKSAVLDLAEGVTVITGPNNVGKSALVEAIRSAAQNPSQSKHAIRHGEKSATVRIEMGSGEIVEWERNERTAVYRVLTPGEQPGAYETETYAKFGRTPPDDVRAILRLDPVDAEGVIIDIHIGNQRYPIFLLDQAGSQAAAFFAASTEAVYLLRMQQALKARTDRNKFRKKELARKCKEIERELGLYAPIEAIGPMLEQAEVTFRQIVEYKRTMPILNDFISNMDEVLSRYYIKTMAASALELLSNPPVLCETAVLDRLIDDLESSLLLHERIGLRHGAFGGLRQTPVLHDVSDLHGVIIFMAKCTTDLEGASVRTDVLEKAAAPPILDNVLSLDALLRELGANTLRMELALGNLRALESLYPPHALTDTGGLAVFIDSYTETTRLHAECKERSHALSQMEQVPELSEIEDLALIIKSLDDGVRGLDHALAKGHALHWITAPAELSDTDDLQSLIDHLVGCEEGLFKCESACTAMTQIQSPPDIKELAVLDSLIDDLSGLDHRRVRVEMFKRTLDAVVPTPDLHRLELVDDLLQQIARMEEGLARLEQSRRVNEQLRRLKLREIEQAISEAGVCPFCGHMMDVTHFLEGMHVGGAFVRSESGPL